MTSSEESVEQVKAHVRALVEEVTGQSLNGVSDEMSLFQGDGLENTAGLDSLDVLKIVICLCQEFRLNQETDIIEERLFSIADIADFVRNSKRGVE